MVRWRCGSCSSAQRSKFTLSYAASSLICSGSVSTGTARFLQRVMAMHSRIRMRVIHVLKYRSSLSVPRFSHARAIASETASSRSASPRR